MCNEGLIIVTKSCKQTAVSYETSEEQMGHFDFDVVNVVTEKVAAVEYGQ